MENNTYDGHNKDTLVKVFVNSIKALKNKGVFYVITTTRNIIYRTIFSNFLWIKRRRYFNFNNSVIPYSINKYRDSWASERTIEVPLVLHFIEKLNSNGKKILEVGNVLNNYKKFNHDVLDKYEKAKGVMNRDIINFNPKTKYDLILSISTLEHVGYDEKPRKHENLSEAFDNIKNNILAKGGELIFTVPIGYNPYLDELIRENRIKGKLTFFKRISLSNKWKEVSKDEALKSKYGIPYECANSIMLGVIRK